MPIQFTEKAHRATDQALAIAEQVWRLSFEFTRLTSAFDVVAEPVTDGMNPLAISSGLNDFDEVLSVLTAWLEDATGGCGNDFGIKDPAGLHERFGRTWESADVEVQEMARTSAEEPADSGR